MDNIPGTPFSLQPTLQNGLIIARPLLAEDFDRLYAAASDPLIWEQHPNQNRWQLSEFTNYFKGAMQSGGALMVTDAQTGEVVGSSRYYDWIADTKTLSIGYTFIVRKYWGGGYNYSLKGLMLDYIFQYVDNILFFIGANNLRSQVSIERFGAKKIGEEDTAYFGEPPKPNFVYRITKQEWLQKNGAG